VDQNAHAVERQVLHVPELVEFADSIVPADHDKIGCGDSILGPAFDNNALFVKEFGLSTARLIG
jgi:hypothetical protein